MFPQSLLVKIIILFICIQLSFQRIQFKATHFQHARNTDQDDDESDEDEVAPPRRPGGPRPNFSTPTIPKPACSPRASPHRLPHLLSPTPMTGLDANHWRISVNWLLERGGDSDPDGLPFTGSVVTVSGSVGGFGGAIRVLPTSPGSATCGNVHNPATGVTATVAAAAHGCEVALSVGCFGNLVSDGTVLRRSLSGVEVGGGVHFGITDASDVFYGYLGDKFADMGKFSQLIGGYGWLVREGKNFLAESLQFECSPSRSAASLASAAATPAARSAIGQKRNGDLAIVHIVGRSGVAGMSLNRFANLLIRLGLVNAINLEAGDATAMVVNGTLVGSPSAICAGDQHSPIACLHPASAILCVPQRDRKPWHSSSTPAAAYGTSVPTVPLPMHASRGCGAGVVACADGVYCDVVGGRCDYETGRCDCRPYFTGPTCEKRRCLCLNAGRCLPNSEVCLCAPGFTGRLCERACPAGFFGQDCRRVCVCAEGQSEACDPVNGTCVVGSAAQNESGLLRSIQQRLRGLGSINLALVTLTGVATLSLLFNFCLLVACCRMRCRQWRRAKSAALAGAPGGGKRYQPMRLVPAGRESEESDAEALM